MNWKLLQEEKEGRKENWHKKENERSREEIRMVEGNRERKKNSKGIKKER
jgi:hypothetical protein